MLLHRYRHPRWLEGFIKRRIVKRLGLNQLQSAQLDVLHQAMSDAHENMHHLQNEAKNDFLQILDADAVQGSQIEQWLSLPGKFIEKSTTSLADNLTRFLSDLNSEQRQKLQSLIRRRWHRQCI